MALLSHNSRPGANDGASLSNVAQIDSRGATLIVVGLAYYSLSGAPSFSDSLGLTWTTVGPAGDPAAAGPDYLALAGYYTWAAPTGGNRSATHSFSNPTGDYSGIWSLAFDGTRTSSDPLLTWTSASNGSRAFTLSVGPISPGVDGATVVALCGTRGYGGPTRPNGITLLTALDATSLGTEGGGSAYEIQTTNTSRTPQWGTLNGGDGGGDIMASLLMAFATGATDAGLSAFRFRDSGQKANLRRRSTSGWRKSESEVLYTRDQSLWTPERKAA